MENSTDFASYMISWLISTLKMEDVSFPLLSQAYRICRANNPAKPFPRDVIITFLNLQMKKLVFDYARENGGILYLNKIQVFLDLAPEALAKRKALKEIMAVLIDAHVRFQLTGPLKLMVFYKNCTYVIHDEESGLEILQLLHLPKPPCPERALLKRKLYTNASPNKKALKSTRTHIGT